MVKHKKWYQEWSEVHKNDQKNKYRENPKAQIECQKQSTMNIQNFMKIIKK